MHMHMPLIRDLFISTFFQSDKKLFSKKK
jgi:hypothetical protein